ncbi:uncharacterized protein CC84DRAFT_708658 [Paraphaeosphaeria sporulosa]|uniref:Uncharacterized protein n=1 Tax=Paraphaeosphaeria sporulosa TaxID=1460663 RepID=A0A177CJP6_9PLEO|nr:uncharacterized protein CC84DRAFT_708658 [Paraphaeosphaeria sporulosa]OAG07745.1 hypothetical protein CC84DRAFT_708658 [Paraphaeosphaeria sporulosa]
MRAGTPNACDVARPSLDSVPTRLAWPAGTEAKSPAPAPSPGEVRGRKASIIYWRGAEKNDNGPLWGSVSCHDMCKSRCWGAKLTYTDRALDLHQQCSDGRLHASSTLWQGPVRASGPTALR